MDLTDNVQKSLDRRFNQGNSIHIEEIQDQVEPSTYAFRFHDVARSYALQEDRNKVRNDQKLEQNNENISENSIKVDIRGDLIELMNQS